MTGDKTMDYLRRTWADIDLDCIVHNYRELKSRLTPGCRTMAVVKADAYGHGAAAGGPGLSAGGGARPLPWPAERGHPAAPGGNLGHNSHPGGNARPGRRRCCAGGG